VAGNWKMNGGVAQAARLAADVRAALAGSDDADVVLCPPFTSLAAVADKIAGTDLGLGAQNLHWEASGAFTGEVSAVMLREVGCSHVIVGHSERRTLFGESDHDVNRKARAALAAGLVPIVCVGETLDERDSSRTERVLRRQLECGLAGLGAGLADSVIAYEPVWAIGTGRTATPDQAQEAHAFIRAVLATVAGGDVASRVRIQYGGSLAPPNAASIFAGADVDGGLVGGASLSAESFAAIVVAACRG